MSLLAASCQKTENGEDCFHSATFLRQITDRPASVKVNTVDNSYYLVEAGSIDTRLIPCNLPAEFRVNDLNVRVTGDVKAAAQTAMGPCCTEYLVIAEITR